MTALAALETTLRRQHGEQTPFTVGDAVAVLVKFKEPALPHPAWREAYRQGLATFSQWLGAPGQ